MPHEHALPCVYGGFHFELDADHPEVAMSEGKLQDAIRLALGRVPGLVLWRNNCGSVATAAGGRIAFGVGNPGGADLIGCYRGRFIAMEVKTPDGRQSPAQRDFQTCVEHNGGVYLMPRSPEDAVRMVSELSPLAG